MNMEPDVKKDWLDELENFISHWEQETEIIKDKTLDFEECCRITDVFRDDWDGLLLKRPPGMADDDFLRLEQLDNKLNSALAMVCGSPEEKLDVNPSTT